MIPSCLFLCGEVAGKTLSPYETLGLKPTASQKEIKRAYLEAALSLACDYSWTKRGFAVSS